jgi:hypothetical protein
MSGMRSCCVLVCCALLSGCGGADGPPTHKLSGTVTYNGSPVPVGNIVLAPDTSAGNKGPGTTAGITDGKFETQPDKGHIGGAYILTITGFDGEPVESGEGGMDPAGTALFSNFTTKVELPEGDEVIEIEVPAQ